jgi:hypothetical protein
VQVRRVKDHLFILIGRAVLGSGRSGAEIIAVVSSFLKWRLTRADLMISNTNNNLVCGIFKWQSDCRVDLDHDVIFTVDQEWSCDFDFFWADVLHQQNRLFSFDCLYLH